MTSLGETYPPATVGRRTGYGTGQCVNRCLAVATKAEVLEKLKGLEEQ